MRHLHFVQAVDPLRGGGLGTAARSLSIALNNIASPSVVVTTYREHEPTGVVAFPRVGPDALYFSPRLLGRAQQLASESDMIHGHGLYVFTNAIFGRACRVEKKPLAYHAHGFFDPWILNRSQWKKKLSHLLFEDKNFKSVRWWRALTDKEADQIVAVSGKKPVVVIPNGIDIPDVQPARHRNSDRRTLLFLGRLHPKKGIDLLIRAFQHVSPKFHDWDLVVVGPDEGRYLSYLAALGENLLREKRLQFREPIWGETDKLGLLANIDLFILTSYSEGMPMAVLEALSVKRPVIASSECNIADLDRHGSWVCKPTVEDVVKHLEIAFATSQSELDARGEEGYRFVKKYYSWNSVALEVERASERYA